VAKPWLAAVAVLLLALAPAAALCRQVPMTPKQASDIEQQVQDLLKEVRGKRVALVTNPTGVDGDMNLIADRLCEDTKTTIVAFFAPEHGLRADIQAGSKVTDYIDPVTSVPVYSIYGKKTAPTDEQLKGVDVLVFDIQDVGARFYTYDWTMTHAMEAAAKNKIKFVVFDRPNPIGADKVEGAPNTFDCGLIGRLWEGKPFGVATRHGLTVGELAMLVNGEWLEPKADLTVIRMPGYRRTMVFEETGRLWVTPSPNMPGIDTAVVYPGLCVFEGTNLSEGRGTTRPFENIGAPFINALELARDLNALNLPGVRFRPTSFVPTFSKFRDEPCAGVQVHVTDRGKFLPVRTGLTVLKTIVSKYPDQVKVTAFAAKLMGIPDLQTRIFSESVQEIEKGWQENLREYMKIRAKYLVYPE
jgi:uncharacterized protein YbbC (DUF1343 family)